MIDSPPKPMMLSENPFADDQNKADEKRAEEDKTEAQSIAQLAAELALPLPADSATESEKDSEQSPLADPANVKMESEVSPERLAMRQLQGRMRKNLLLKRPVPASEDEEFEATSPENPHAEAVVSAVPTDIVEPAETAQTPEIQTETTGTVLPVPSDSPAEPESPPVVSFESDPDATTTELSLLAPPGPRSDASSEVGLITKPETVDLKVGDKPEETIVPVPEAPKTPARQVIRIEKSSEVFTQLHTAIEYAVGNRNFQTDGLTNASLFQGTRPLVLGVTSAVAGEGKTTVALHLAMDIARNNFKKVCLMDMSLGEDTLSRRLEVNIGAGLVNVLEGTHHTLPTIDAAECDGLSIMPAGKTPDNAARAARSPALPEIINAGRKLFDVILVDMPSITSGNVLPIAPYVDAIVMVVYAGVTPKEVVADSLERLDKNKVLGVVLNRVTTSMPNWLQQRLNRW